MASEEGTSMEKSLRCADVDPRCNFVICGDTEKEIFEKATDHAKQAHGMTEIPRDIWEKARSFIREGC